MRQGPTWRRRYRRHPCGAFALLAAKFRSIANRKRNLCHEAFDLVEQERSLEDLASKESEE